MARGIIVPGAACAEHVVPCGGLSPDRNHRRDCAERNAARSSIATTDLRRRRGRRLREELPLPAAGHGLGETTRTCDLACHEVSELGLGHPQDLCTVLLKARLPAPVIAARL